jgi:hypothetical protein
MPSPEELLQALESAETLMSNIQPKFKGILYGNSGKGKTVLAFWLALRLLKPDELIYYVDTAENWVSILNHPDIASQRHRIIHVNYKGFSQLETLKMVLEAKIGKYANIGVLILDEATSIARADLMTVTASRALSDATKDPDTPTWPDRNTAQNRYQKLSEEFVKLPIHFIKIGHERSDKNNLNIPVFSPSFSPSLCPLILQPIHYVGRVLADEVTIDGQVIYNRYIQSHPINTSVAKSRIGGLDLNSSFDTFVEGVVKWIDDGGILVPERKPLETEAEVLAAEEIKYQPIVVED